VVFNTSMTDTGILTDRRTRPDRHHDLSQIGNMARTTSVGVRETTGEGFIVKEYLTSRANWRMKRSLDAYLKDASDRRNPGIDKRH